MVEEIARPSSIVKQVVIVISLNEVTSIKIDKTSCERVKNVVIGGLKVPAKIFIKNKMTNVTDVFGNSNRLKHFADDNTDLYFKSS